MLLVGGVGWGVGLLLGGLLGIVVLCVCEGGKVVYQFVVDKAVAATDALE